MQTKPPYIFDFPFKALAKKFNLRYSTVRMRAIGEVEGYSHASGGKGKSKVLSKKVEGKKTESISLYTFYMSMYFHNFSKTKPPNCFYS